MDSTPPSGSRSQDQRPEPTATVLHLGTAKGDSFRAGFERWMIHTDQLMTVVIDIENGPWKEADPAHTHPHEQITYVAEGEVLFFCEGLVPVRLAAGDLYAIPTQLAHSIQLLSERARLVDCFTPLRNEFLKKQ